MHVQTYVCICVYRDTYVYTIINLSSNNQCTFQRCAAANRLLLAPSALVMIIARACGK